MTARLYPASAEELTRRGRLLWWSPRGDYFAFAVLNDTSLPLYSYPLYGSGANELYDQLVRVRYAKAGDGVAGGGKVCPQVVLHVYAKPPGGGRAGGKRGELEGYTDSPLAILTPPDDIQEFKYDTCI